MTARTVLLAAGLLLASCATPIEADAPDAAFYADHLVGRVAQLRQDHSAAADRYFAALRRDPHNDALLAGAVTASLASGDIARARQAARMAPRDDASAYAHAVRAADHLAAGRSGAAANELARVQGGAAERLLARMMLVWARAGDRRVDDILAELAPLASIRPYGGLFAYQQAMALDYAGRRDEALASYAVAAENGMFLPPAVERHADLLARMGQRDQAAAVLAHNAFATNPALAAAHARLLEGRAISDSRITPAQGAAIGVYGLGAVFQQENDVNSALAAFTLALMLDPRLDPARISFAQVQASLGHTDLARSALEGVAAESVYAGTARLMQAWTLLDQGQEDEGLAMAQAAAESGDARSRRALADMYRSLGRNDEAEALYSEVIAANEDDWRLYFSRGAARERVGRWPEAEADLQRALELAPEQPEVLNYLGYTWVDRGERLQEGLAMIQRAVELRPHSGAIIDSLGWAYYRLGDYDQALTHLERAVELEPADPTLNDHLGDVYWQLGRRIEARFQWRRALSYEPDDPAAIEAKLQHGLEPAARAATR